MQVQFDEANGDMNLEPSVTLKFDVLYFSLLDWVVQKKRKKEKNKGGWWLLAVGQMCQ
jgi:hypothetical protein